jgi:hypothetical protein|tara:strand:- start:38 stop:241 length:204 start_codon:yes stop_codon:yes gene_type:complete
MTCFKDKYTHAGHEDKYKVFLVYDESLDNVERLAGMGNTMPYPRLSSMLVGAKWQSARTKKTYERIL